MTEEKTIPYIAHESEVARLERVIKRLWILCIIIFICLIGTNAGWIYYENQFTDETSVVQDIDTGNGNAVFSGIGDVSIGTDQAKSNQEKSEKDW